MGGTLPLNIALIGTLPPPVGGTSVSLRHLVRALEHRDEVRLKVVNTGGMRGAGLQGVGQFVKVLKGIYFAVRQADVVTLHVGIHALPWIGPFVVFFCSLFKKPLLIRRFGGKDHRELKGLAFQFGAWVIRHADLYLVQTKALKKGAEAAGIDRVEWFPTTRPASEKTPAELAEKTLCRRFIFLGHLRITKGVREVINAAERLPAGASVSVYGPLYDALDGEIFRGCKQVQYCGAVEPDQVPEILRGYDALILPTYYEGEGYPGVILEAFNAGIPVVTTTWKAIPEIVDETCGMLVPPRDADALCRAMTRLVENDQLYRGLVEGARKRQFLFNFELWTDRFIQFCESQTKIGVTKEGKQHG
ncbi:MAG: glycosyltransferase family 4 protein [Syntrophotaleaceae bacterium]